MTILITVVIELINRILTESNENSVVNDNSMIYGWSFLRDKANSSDQRVMTIDIQKLISEFKPEKTDKESITAIKKIITKENYDIELMRKKKGLPAGDLNKTLNDINSHLDSFVCMLEQNTLQQKEFNLIDIEDSNDPFNILCKHAAYYLGEHMMCPTKENVFGKMVGSLFTAITGTNAIEIRGKKEQCLIAHLIECKKRIDGLDKAGAAYQELRETMVKEQIETILRENAEICEESKPVNTIPVQLTMFVVANIPAPTIKPSRGRLKISLENALEEIDETSPLTEEKKAGQIASINIKGLIRTNKRPTHSSNSYSFLNKNNNSNKSTKETEESQKEPEKEESKKEPKKEESQKVPKTEESQKEPKKEESQKVPKKEESQKEPEIESTASTMSL